MNYIKQFLGKLIYQIIIFFLPVLLHSQNLLNGPNDIVFDTLNNHYLVANWAGNSIVAIDSLGNQSYFRTNVTHAHGMDIKDSILFVASYRNLLLLDLTSASVIGSIYVPGSEYLGHIALGSFNYVYITDWSARKLFRINITDQTSTTLHTFNPRPVGIYYEEINNRLILLTLANNAPILAYNLTSGNLDTIRYTNINDPDAICRDADGNFYVTSFSDNTVYRFDPDFSTSPEIISIGHGGPSGVGYNVRDNIIGVTNYNFNSIDLIQLNPSNDEHEKHFEPKTFTLFQNYPNPFNSTTTINYFLPSATKMDLKIYNTLGQEVRALVDEFQSYGSKSVVWDGMDDSSRMVNSGIYFYQFHAGDIIQSKKMLLLK